METTMNNIHPDTSNPTGGDRQHGAASRPAGRPGDDVVRWREFRQAQWIGGIALAAILGGQGFLYLAIMGLQGEMHTQLGGLRTEMHIQINGLRTEMHIQINGLRSEMHTQFTELRASIHELSERVARIETRLDLAAGPADKGT